MSAAENVLSMRKISHGANKIKNIRELKNYRNISHRSEGCPISSEVPCFISKGGPCMKQVPVALLTRIQCKVSDAQVTVKACGPLVFNCKFYRFFKYMISDALKVSDRPFKNIFRSI